VQVAMMRSVKGLERVEIAQPGYAVEYDHIDPRALGPRLEVSAIGGLFCAGQINGTTGYEEASAQGLVAGLNAAARALGTPPVVLDRASSYIGVMIDDLVLQGITEPYRMLTARAEYRLRLRADNASTRLTPLALDIGCVGAQRAEWFAAREAERTMLIAMLQSQRSPDRRAETLYDLIRIDGLDATGVAALEGCGGIASAVIDEVVEDARYAPYVARQDAEIRAMRANDRIGLSGLDYRTIAGLSNEMREKLEAAQPVTLGAAERVRGITPAALAAILVQAKRAAA
jgi:tRNA uridine 5-carboxymethylaminomethyl modification enzyme